MWCIKETNLNYSFPCLDIILDIYLPPTEESQKFIHIFVIKDTDQHNTVTQQTQNKPTVETL